ncbi:MAG: hypothetical protein LW814_08220 [Anabaena sp. CoA2_C59]|jgi:hypothetical protein|uniref:hypothetical protein n=1 Tax=Nostocales TaxID=1161 RepID=UPI00029B5CE8|nr:MULTISPECIES: hypothetical protein [Nostocales]MBO1052724.1 hypothetical protein [Dolichospermum sp. DET73]MCE2905002.1 hypothetical protein [Anabaena sp. CoA2_C59]MDJ0505417.1 hypothetical protein [Nostocales cyanobacterium LE14-WE12]AFW94613.1 hypothetical protein ANA_C11856 [Anabaena sp. 90]MTJ15803.1 hypothetical protein [Dolichospermum sp. UHCC 0299]
MSLKIIDEVSNTTYLLTEVTSTFNDDEYHFELSDSSGTKVYIDYVLTAYNDYKPEDYSLFIFKSWILNSENNIFQAYEKDINERVGWMFPIQSLVSNEHKYVSNSHFLKYAYVAFLKLLINREQYETFTPYLQTIDSYRLTEFYGDDIIILVLSNTQIQKLDNFHIDNYLTSLYSYSYYYCQPIDNFKEINSRANFQSPGDTRLILQRNSSYLQGEVYLHRLFKSLLKTEEHPLVRFYLLYQVIELIIEIIFEKSFSDIINNFQNNTDKNIYELKESIASISSEKERISKLIATLEKHFDGNTKTNLLLYCNDLLVAFNSEKKDSLALALYAVRSLIVHKFRKLPEKDLPKIAEINKEFENIVIKIILNYEEISI